jgi:hypothetical protein
VLILASSPAHLGILLRLFPACCTGSMERARPVWLRRCRLIGSPGSVLLPAPVRCWPQWLTRLLSAPGSAWLAGGCQPRLAHSLGYSWCRAQCWSWLWLYLNLRQSSSLFISAPVKQPSVDRRSISPVGSPTCCSQRRSVLDPVADSCPVRRGCYS